MEKLTRSLFVFFFILNSMSAQINPGARQIALAHSDLTSGTDLFSVFNNPAGTAGIQRLETAFYYSPAPCGLNELSNAFAIITFPVGKSSISAGFSIYGFDLYKVTQFALCYSQNITNSFIIGITPVIKHYSVKNYGGASVFLINAGAIARLSHTIDFGFSISNLTRSSLLKGQFDQPVEISLGGCIRPDRSLSVYTAIAKETGFNPSLRIGAEYNISNLIRLRAGTGSEPDIYCIGFGFIYKLFQFNYSVSVHPILGLTHQFDCAVSFNNN